MNLKQKVHDQYMQVITGSILRLQQNLSDLKESGANETKSTAGDKHETALAMLQIEQANNRAQLQEAMAHKEILQNLKPLPGTQKIMIGSLVKTNKGYFYMSVALGKTLVDNETVYALSPQSPLGAKLVGLTVGEKIQLNGNDYLIEEIL